MPLVPNHQSLPHSLLSAAPALNSVSNLYDIDQDISPPPLSSSLVLWMVEEEGERDDDMEEERKKREKVADNKKGHKLSKSKNRRLFLKSLF